MLLTLVITLLLIWAAVVGSLYSWFLTFYQNFAETENYNKAYYAAIWALERAELVVRQRDSWYEWSWWWKSFLDDWSTVRETSWISPSDWLITSWFSYLTSWSSQWTNMFWTIKSRAKRIPEIWQWNVDWTMAADDSLNYNRMNYEDAEIFLLYYDNWSIGWPYRKTSCSDSTTACSKSNLWNWITWEIRLPPKLYGWEVNFGPLDQNVAMVAWTVKDDAIVDRQLKGEYNTEKIPFTIYSTQDINNTNSIWFEDSVIRESVINNWANLSFSGSTSPIAAGKNQITIISPEEKEIKEYEGRIDFKKIFHSTSAFKKLQLRFALLNILKTPSPASMVYPYLEYFMDFWWNEVSDRFFTMNAEWKYWDFQVNLIVQKPTAKESIVWSFTTIFK